MRTMFTPIDIRDYAHRLEMTPGQVCRIARITRMQLDYWTQKAQIPTGGLKQRTFDYRGLELILLIKQARDIGMELDPAIRHAKAFAQEQMV